MFYKSVQSVRQSKSFRFVLEANEKTNSCSELLTVFENWLSGCLPVLDGMEHGHNVWYQLWCKTKISSDHVLVSHLSGPSGQT